jgi:hypothetical protein
MEKLSNNSWSGMIVRVLGFVFAVKINSSFRLVEELNVTPTGKPSGSGLLKSTLSAPLDTE